MDIIQAIEDLPLEIALLIMSSAHQFTMDFASSIPATRSKISAWLYSEPGRRWFVEKFTTMNIQSNFQIWILNGKIHREHDLPAIIYADGDQYWYRNGIRHRDHDSPAVIYANGDQQWYQNGELYRYHN